MFVDWAGDTMTVINLQTGDVEKPWLNCHGFLGEGFAIVAKKKDYPGINLMDYWCEAKS
jgi:hypothetical protein